jgi:23S rRNA (pseudouridine1915-N3)-methyltransferase
MKISIVSVGKVKEKFFIDAINEYKKRLSKFCTIIEEIVQDERADENFSVKEIEQVKFVEGQKILKKIKDSSYAIVLCIEGNQLSSTDLADKISTLAINGNSDICFIIGGSNGLSDEVINRADMKLSFSKMTFPHQLFKVLLFEQIYRAFKINANESYHK